MNPRLSWRDAESKDNTALQSFTCTPSGPKDARGRRLQGPRPWERRVEAAFRRMQPPIGDGRLLLGEDAEGLAAIALMYFLGQEDGACLVKLAGIAVALRCQGRGYGEEALEMALRAAADYGFGLNFTVVNVMSLVDHRNARSKAVGRRAGMRVDSLDVEDGLEEWRIDLELPEET